MKFTYQAIPHTKDGRAWDYQNSIEVIGNHWNEAKTEAQRLTGDREVHLAFVGIVDHVQPPELPAPVNPPVLLLLPLFCVKCDRPIKWIKDKWVHVDGRVKHTAQSPQVIPVQLPEYKVG